jgi:cobalamin biosynthesis protein CobD/CbiB
MKVNLLKKLEEISKKIAKLKVYLQRAMIYGSVINFILIIGTFIKVWGISLSFWLLIPLTIIPSIIVGYIDVEVLKLFKYENDIMNLHNRIEEIKKDLEKIKEKLRIE